MKLAGAILIGIMLIFIGLRVYAFIGQEHDLSQNLSDMQTRLMQVKADEADLLDETHYLSNPTNLEKEMRSQFNYKKPGETMMIIVPAQGQASTTR